MQTGTQHMCHVTGRDLIEHSFLYCFGFFTEGENP